MKRTKKDAAARLLISLVPAFIFTNTLGVLLTLSLPGSKLTNLSYVITFAFLFYSVLVMWVFHTTHLKAALSGICIGILLCSGASYLLY
ncbi:MAG: hypothetical protein AAGJ37_01825 [Pseudomonadota bacterium]